jgi:hypothetical protein
MAGPDNLSPEQFSGTHHTTSATYTDTHSPKHSRWSFNGPQGKHRKAGKSRNKSGAFYQPEHAKGATGYTGRHSRITENS